MSNMRQLSGEDYPDAARKHYTDARALMNRRRYDGAAYLAGYVVECILKTLIQVDRSANIPIREFKHDLNRLSGEALRLAALPSSRTAPYMPRGAFTSISYADPPSGWKETLRYHYEGTISKTTASLWIAEAKRLYMHVIGRLRQEGKVIL
jgi:hypothetical protein